MPVQSWSFDFRGCIEHTHVPLSQPLLPLFEAIANAIDAIEEGGASSPGRVEVKVRRGPVQMEIEPSPGRTPFPPITGFVVSDTGVGFTDDNVESFMTRYSRYKAADGGKGVGRFAWFKTFRRVFIESRYAGASGRSARTWGYESTHSELESWRDATHGDHAFATVLTLDGFREEYEEKTPRSPEALADRILDHFLSLFVLGHGPTITLVDDAGSAPIDLDERYRDVVVEHAAEEVPLLDTVMTVHHLILRRPTELPGGVVYCARARAVERTPPDRVVADLPESFDSADGKRSYRAYVSGPAFERSVNSNRTAFHIDRAPAPPRESPALISGRLTWGLIEESLRPGCSAFIEPFLTDARGARNERIESFLANAPWYRGLVDEVPSLRERIPVNVTTDAMDLRLYEENIRWRSEVHRRGAQLIDDLDRAGPDDIAGIRERLLTHQVSLSAEKRDDLARYVAHRRAVLLLLEKCLRLREDGRHEVEGVLHDIFMQRGTDSRGRGHFDHNLWIIDEQLAFHEYAASDKALANHDVLDSESRKEPDIVAYSRAVFLERPEEEAKCRTVVIVEFKRPGRIDYGTASDPIQQVRNYAGLIASGNKKADDGTSIEVGSGTRYYGYVIADPADRLHGLVDHHELEALPNEAGYGKHFKKPVPLYLEVCTFRQALTLAQRRNAVFFQLLGIRGPLRDG